jgi:hypothetical protein
MALIDITEVLCDQDFLDTITISATQRLVGANGRAADLVLPPAQVSAVVLPVAQRLILISDGALRDGAISIYTTYAITGGFKTDDAGMRLPDVVSWHGRGYVVASVEDYSAFGNGWFHATANLQQINPTA